MAQDQDKKTVLVLEDERSLADIIATKLKEEGFSVFAFPTIEGGMEILEKHKVDFIWLDHYLAGGERGITFVQELKNHEEWGVIPIFVVSNTVNVDDVNNYLDLGVTKYFIKSDNKIDDIVKDLKGVLMA